LAGLLSYGPIEATAHADDDTPESFDALKAEAAQGNVAAQFNLGFMYSNGEGVPHDDVQAVKWYRQLAARGYSGAQYSLDVMYANGEGAPHQAHHLYEKLYCARGEMENRTKECQLDLYADRTSARTMPANQLRLWFAAMAYVLMCALHRIGLAHTRFARACCGTIRLKLLKIGALVKTSVRCIKLAMPSAFPCHGEYQTAHAALTVAATA
jgi:Transposase DDE domain group 1/Sel1 repeat